MSIQWPYEYFCRADDINLVFRLTGELVVRDSIHHALDVYLDFRNNYGGFDTYLKEKLEIDQIEDNLAVGNAGSRSLESFVNECCEIDELWGNPVNPNVISKVAFVDAFKQWHQTRGIEYDETYWTMTKLTKTLKHLVPHLRFINQKYVGIRLKPQEVNGGGDDE